MKKILIPITSLIAFSLIVSCDKGTKNPESKYPGLQGDIPPVNQVIETQKYKTGCGIIATDDANNPNNTNWVVAEGETLTKIVKLSGPHLRNNDDLLISGNREYLNVVSKNSNPQNSEIEFKITYSPPMGFIKGNDTQVSLPIEISPTSQLQNIYKCPLEVTIFVTRNTLVPIITQINNKNISDLSTGELLPINLILNSDKKITNPPTDLKIKIQIQSNTSLDSNFLQVVTYSETLKRDNSGEIDTIDLNRCLNRSSILQHIKTENNINTFEINFELNSVCVADSYFSEQSKLERNEIMEGRLSFAAINGTSSSKTVSNIASIDYKLSLQPTPKPEPLPPNPAAAASIKKSTSTSSKPPPKSGAKTPPKNPNKTRRTTKGKSV